MSAITPSTDLYLVKVPIEIDNANQLTFANATAQYNYFAGLQRIGETDFTYQRKDGVIRYPAHIDSIINYNYVMYKNDNYSNKWFYAFIDDMRYVNDGMTEISIKTDVWQTWQFDLEYKQCFVEREHVNDDTIGEHTVPEGLETGEYSILDLRNIPIYESGSSFPSWMVCFAVSEVPTTTSTPPAGKAFNGETNTVGGVFTSLHFFAVTHYSGARSIIKRYEQDGKVDAIINLFLVPSNCVDIDPLTNNLASGGTPSNITVPDSQGPVSIYPIVDSTTVGPFQIQQPSTLAGGYIPKNNKLLTYPYTYFYVSNKAGEDVVFRWEDFPFETIGSNYARTATYKKAFVPSTSLSSKLYFTNYKGHSETSDYGTRLYNYGVNFAKIPVCAWTTDYYTNWLTQNGVNMASSVITGTVGGALAGGVAGAATGAAGTIINSLTQMYQASITPDQAHGDIGTGDVMFAYTRGSISLYEMSIRPEYAAIIDNYFSMKGYKVNSVKVPNVTGRRNWNYVKTIDCTIHAYIPQEDCNEIKEMFNNGVTFWHNPATFLDYSQNNSII